MGSIPVEATFIDNQRLNRFQMVTKLVRYLKWASQVGNIFGGYILGQDQEILRNRFIRKESWVGMVVRIPFKSFLCWKDIDDFGGSRGQVL